ncbi:hypothetical protein F2P81_004144 [Scophthalmus maximus]|uniref:Vacuolar protein sorting-associated protein 33B n=1 Tax=Scophthalmus maximus TaxID=52904 RepID=A0A6A4T8Y1_SCOMX|nr:hypothetical protein F2P81_004144 [Scophthalmus maximus]
MQGGYGCVEFGTDVTSSDKRVKVMLNSQDKVFDEIRNEHFSNVFGFLSQKAKNLQTAYDKRRGMDIQQIKTFVSEELKGLKQEHRLLSLRECDSGFYDIGASESMMKKKTKQDFQELLKTEHSLLEGFEIRECITFIEEHINRQVSMIESLRLLCLLSITENGLLPKDYRSLKAQYLQSYGVDHLLTFANLKQSGLLVEQQPGETLTVMESKVGKLVNDKAAGKLTDAFSSLAKKSHFRALSKKLNLVPKSDEEYDLRVPRDMAYIFSGAYVPLSCKLVEQSHLIDGLMGIIGVWEESIGERDPALVPPFMLEHERGQSFSCTWSVGLVFAVRPSGSYVTGGKRASGVFMALGRKSEGRGRYHTLR